MSYERQNVASDKSHPVLRIARQLDYPLDVKGHPDQYQRWTR